MAECRHLLGPGGILCLTEVVDWGSGISLAFKQMRKRWSVMEFESTVEDPMRD
jgi:hypothetical protein